jgi:carboxylesterase type B
VGGYTNCTEDMVQGADEELLARTMATYWANFCRSGDPNKGDTPKTKLAVQWDPWTEQDETSLRLDLPSLSAEKGRNDVQCDFIDSIGAVKSKASRLAN